MPSPLASPERRVSPNAGISSSCIVSPQTLQLILARPGSVAVGSVMTSFSPSVWAVGFMVQSYDNPQPVQVKVVRPSVVQLGYRVITPSS